MFCPECGSRLQNGYCPQCRVKYTYPWVNARKRICPQCNRGEMVLQRERAAGLLLLPVGAKSTVYKCTVCGYELSEKNFGTLRDDKEFQQAKKDLKNGIKKRIKNIVKK